MSRPAPIVPILFATLGFCGLLNAQQAKIDVLPGFGKPQRSGYTITVEGGEDGPKSVYYEDKQPRAPKTPVMPSGNLGPGVPPSAGQVSPSPAGTPNTAAPVTLDKTLETDSVDPVVSRFMTRETNLSSRRVDRETADSVDTDARFDRGAPVGFGRWGDSDTRYGMSRAETLDMGARFDTGERVERNNITFDRVERERFMNGDKRAEVPAWTERFSRDKNDKFSDTAPRNAFANKFVDGMSLLTRVSMQQINRNNFRRSHSESKGELPVGVMATGELRPPSDSVE